MSVEENKKIHTLLNEKVWINRNLDDLDEVYHFPVNFAGKTFTKEELIEGFKKLWANEEGRKLEKVEHHARAGEGNILMVWQTNYSNDGSKQEGMTLLEFQDGKVKSNKWFPAPENSE